MLGLLPGYMLGSLPGYVLGSLPGYVLAIARKDEGKLKILFDFGRPRTNRRPNKSFQRMKKNNTRLFLMQPFYFSFVQMYVTKPIHPWSDFHIMESD